jgi:hypothetical protein
VRQPLRPVRNRTVRIVARATRSSITGSTSRRARIKISAGTQAQRPYPMPLWWRTAIPHIFPDGIALRQSDVATAPRRMRAASLPHRMFATGGYGDTAWIGRADRVAAGPSNFGQAHFKTAHAAIFVKITAPPKCCAPRAVIVASMARRSSHCECEERQNSYFSHVRFHILSATGTALALYAARQFRLLLLATSTARLDFGGPRK